MVTVKNLTDIIKLERVQSENKTKSALIRSITHELRTPVNGIFLLVDQLMSKVSGQSLELLKHIQICAKLLAFQISDIIDYSEIITGSFTINPYKCDLKKCIAECVSLISVQAKYKGLELRTRIDSLIPDECFVDGYRVQKILMNLLSNAIKFTNKGFIEICAINTGNGVSVSVCDTGIGIQKERIEFIFDMLSDESTSAHSGLGLFISNTILNKLGTTFHVESTLGEGSIFCFNLKNLINTGCYKFSKELEIPAECKISSNFPKFSLKIFENDYPKIMIVDDNDFNRMCLTRILNERGIRYIEAVNGEIAVKRVMQCDKKKKPLKCIIMDCNMPVMDGWEATKIITTSYKRGQLQVLPTIIGHTAYSAPEDIKKCYESGMVSYILKPVTQELFLAIIQKYN